MSVSRQGGRRLPQPAHNQRGRWTRRRKKGNLFDDSNPRQVIAWDSGVPLLGLSALRTSWALPRTFMLGHAPGSIQKCGPFGSVTSQHGIALSGTSEIQRTCRGGLLPAAWQVRSGARLSLCQRQGRPAGPARHRASDCYRGQVMGPGWQLAWSKFGQLTASVL